MAELHQAGLAYGLLLFAGTFVIASLLLAVLGGPFEQLLSTSTQAGNSTALQNGRQWTQQAFTFVPLFTALFASVMIIARVVRERGGL
jgi:hypothetical protein